MPAPIFQRPSQIVCFSSRDSILLHEVTHKSANEGPRVKPFGRDWLVVEDVSQKLVQR